MIPEVGMRFGDDPPGFQELLSGQTIDLPEEESNTVRIFLSSTFTGMQHFNECGGLR